MINKEDGLRGILYYSMSWNFVTRKTPYLLQVFKFIYKLLKLKAMWHAMALYISFNER